MKYNKVLSIFKFSVLIFLCGLMHTAKANETIINESEGMFYCSGGAQTYILSTNCKKLTLKRIIVGSAMAYEGQCLDNNNKDHVFACQSYAFTYKNRVIQKEDFWTKSKKNK